MWPGKSARETWVHLSKIFIQNLFSRSNTVYTGGDAYPDRYRMGDFSEPALAIPADHEPSKNGAIDCFQGFNATDFTASHFALVGNISYKNITKGALEMVVGFSHNPSGTPSRPTWFARIRTRVLSPG